MAAETGEDVHDSMLKSPGRLINILANQMKRRYVLHQEDKGLTNMQRHVLHFILLSTMHGEIYQKDVEAEFEIRRSTATGILKLMEKHGFIERECDERDGRLKRIIPTQKAVAMRQEVLRNIREIQSKMVEGIEPGEFEVCMKVLARMSRNLYADERRTTEEQGGSDESKTV